MLDEGDLELGCFSWNVSWAGSFESPAEAFIFEEALWGALVVIFLSKTSVAQIVNKCSGKEADGLNTHSQPEDLPYQAWLSNLLFLALQLCWRKSNPLGWKGEELFKSC